MSLSGKSILVIDDDSDMRALVQKVLENSGMQTKGVSSVKAGIEAALASPPHLVLLDLEMPGEDGFAFLERRRADVILGSVPVIILSSQSEATTVVRSIKLGATDYAVKPFQSSMLLQKIRKAFYASTEKRSPNDGFFYFEPRPSIRASLSAEITRIGLTDVLIDCQVRLGSGKAVDIDSPLLESLHYQARILKSSQFPSVRLGNLQYRNHLQMVSLTENNQQEMQKGLNKWVRMRRNQAPS